jgi:signal transduction histidine kinase
MKQSQRYVFLFTSFVGLSTFAMAGWSAFALASAYSGFAAAPNKDLAAALWKRMAFSAEIRLFLGALAITAIAIPIGIGLWHAASRKYQGLLRRLEALAVERLGLEDATRHFGSGENALEEFVPVLIRDLEQIRNRDKIEAWKEGARMLMHELKNPLTPLKLSAQRLALDGNETGGSVGRILEATESIERILGYFKNLVNVEFGAKEAFPWDGFMDEIVTDITDAHKPVRVVREPAGTAERVFSERTLLRMVLDNLINNGLEAHPAGITMRIEMMPAGFAIDIFTPEARIADPERVFRPGFSTKGKARGYGLFLCKSISDYLELGLWFRQEPDGVRFGMLVAKTTAEKAMA